MDSLLGPCWLADETTRLVFYGTDDDTSSMAHTELCFVRGFLLVFRCVAGNFAENRILVRQQVSTASSSFRGPTRGRCHDGRDNYDQADDDDVGGTIGSISDVLICRRTSFAPAGCDYVALILATAPLRSDPVFHGLLTKYGGTFVFGGRTS